MRIFSLSSERTKLAKIIIEDPDPGYHRTKTEKPTVDLCWLIKEHMRGAKMLSAMFCIKLFPFLRLLMLLIASPVPQLKRNHKGLSLKERSNILGKILGVKDSGTKAGTQKIKVPQYMIDLYKRYAGSEGASRHGSIVRSFFNEGKQYVRSFSSLSPCSLSNFALRYRNPV